MSDSNIEPETLETDVAPDELTLLKQRADLLGVTYSNSIGTKALKLKIDNKLSGVKDEPEVAEVTSAGSVVPMTQADRDTLIRKEMHDEQMKMIRVRIMNLHPNKKDLHGEILTVANRYLGIVKKFIPYGEVTEDGYHVPYVLYQQLKDRKFLSIKTRRNKQTGATIVDQNWVPEFSLEVLPPLTQDELNRLATTQAAAGGVS